MDIISYALSKKGMQQSVSDYLDEHLTNPTNPPLDTSLEIAGAAADSKATGDKLSALKEDLSYAREDIDGINTYLFGSVPMRLSYQHGRFTPENGYQNNKPRYACSTTKIQGGTYTFPTISGYYISLIKYTSDSAGETIFGYTHDEKDNITFTGTAILNFMADDSSDTISDSEIIELNDYTFYKIELSETTLNQKINDALEIYTIDLLRKYGLQPNSNQNIATGIKQCAWMGEVWENINGNFGSKVYAPANSMPAYRKAIVDNFDRMWIAVVRCSSDGVFYCIHDPTTESVSSTNITIAESTSSAIDTVLLTDRSNNHWSNDDLHIPKLEDVIRLCVSNNMAMGFRLTGLPSDIETQGNQTIWENFIALCTRYAQDDAVYSGSMDQIAILHSYKPNWHIQSVKDENTETSVVLSYLQEMVTKGYTNCSFIVYIYAMTGCDGTDTSAVPDYTKAESIMSYARANNIKIYFASRSPYINGYYKDIIRHICPDAVITTCKIDFLY